ncbi:DUF4031 domain-containing protein [Micromonospora peucetia]|uniref:DUF4031 domain-containing protein n=1 Tax=Micromonospora peucetia TaxID=47871 RepID=UPI003321FDCC
MLYLDRPAWPWRGRLWSHLISDVSPAELHAFAEALGVPRRGFDRDHYDIPAERFAVAVWLGARVVPSRELVRLLRQSGLRRPKHLTHPNPPTPPTLPPALHPPTPTPTRTPTPTPSCPPAVTHPSRDLALPALPL